MDVLLGFQVGISVPWLIESEEVLHLNVKLGLSLIELIDELLDFAFLDLAIVPGQLTFLIALESDFMETDHWSELNLVLVGPVDLCFIGDPGVVGVPPTYMVSSRILQDFLGAILGAETQLAIDWHVGISVKWTGLIELLFEECRERNW